ncbi:hypothetical protein CL689_02750 [Candidatus Saccharibacteria bacterium]|nr:hypothetical protein [Candidatus Saccharibacteria bacterium]
MGILTAIMACIRSAYLAFRRFLVFETKGFVARDLWPKEHVFPAFMGLFGWPFLLVVFLQLLSLFFTGGEVLSKTLKDFEDGYAWNAIGSFGFVVFGFLLLFPGSTRLLRLARSVLLAASSIGFTTFYVSISTALSGVPFGDMLPSFFGQAIFAFSWITLLAFCFVFMTWYPLLLLGADSDSTSSFLLKMQATSLLFRLFAGGGLSLVTSLAIYWSIVFAPTAAHSAPPRIVDSSCVIDSQIRKK